MAENQFHYRHRIEDCKTLEEQAFFLASRAEYEQGKPDKVQVDRSTPIGRAFDRIDILSILALPWNPADIEDITNFGTLVDNIACANVALGDTVNCLEAIPKPV